jgi:hypothetical protein
LIQLKPECPRDKRYGSYGINFTMFYLSAMVSRNSEIASKIRRILCC